MVFSVQLHFAALEVVCSESITWKLRGAKNKVQNRTQQLHKPKKKKKERKKMKKKAEVFKATKLIKHDFLLLRISE